MPDRNRNRIGGGPEFEVAYYTKELGKSLQREMLQKQIDQLGDDRIKNAIGSSPGEDASPTVNGAPPAEDRAG